MITSSYNVAKNIKHFCVQVLLVAFAGCSFAAPQVQTSTEPIPILKQEQEINFDGSYKWEYGKEILIIIYLQCLFIHLFI